MLYTDEDGDGERQVHTSFHAVVQGRHQVQDHLEGQRLFLWMYCCIIQDLMWVVCIYFGLRVD